MNQFPPAVESAPRGKNIIYCLYVKNSTLGLGPLAISYRVSKNLICIAALLSKKSAASLISLALSTSAFAEITLD